MKQKLFTFLCLCILCIGSAWGENKTATFSGWTYSSGKITSGSLQNAPTGAKASLSTTYTNANQMTKDKSQTLTLSGFDGCTIKGVTVHVKTNASSGGGTGTLTINGNEKGALAATGTIGGTYKDKTFTVTPTTVNESGTVVIVLKATANSFYCDKYSIIYEENTNPSITASNIDLAADATSGEIVYTISNPVEGKTVSASTTADWISDINVGTEKVTFTTTANTGDERTADITLTYEGATNKVVKVTQKKYVQVYAIDLATGIVGGTIEASAAEAAAGSTISLTAHPTSGYALNEWSVKDADNNPITVNNHSFIMPGKDVYVSATFKEVNYLFYESFDTNGGTGGNDNQWSGSIASNNIASDNAGWTFGNGYGANQCAKFGAGSKKGSAKTPVINASGCMTLTFKAAAWKGDEESTTLNISTTSGTLSKSYVTLVKGAWTEYKITISGAENPQITFEAANASNNRFFLDEILITNKAVVAITKAGWATACIPFDATVSGDVTAYYVTVTDGKLIQTPIEEDEHIAAETGILLKSNSGNETKAVFTQVALDEDKVGDAWYDNMLIGTTKAEGEDFEESGYTYYILSDGENGVGFYWDGENYDEFEGAGAHCNQYKAVLAVPTGSGAPSFFTFDDATAINGISTVKASGVRYNLNGQAVGEDYKGIVIVNGKKMFNK